VRTIGKMLTDIVRHKPITSASHRAAEVRMGKQRREDILLRLRRQGYVSVRQLADEFEVDASTVRRDLDTMARLGVVARSHGGATLSSEPAETPYDVKVARQVRQKRGIARAVAQRVDDGCSLLLDSGSTTLEVARALREHRDLTVVTNDLRVAAEMADHAGIRLLVPGGELQPSVYTLNSERAASLIRDFHVDQAILGADAVDHAGITNANHNEVEMKRAMIRSADRVVVVADSTKFGTTALVRVAGFEQVDLVVTDTGLAEEVAAGYPVTVLRVPTDEEPADLLADRRAARYGRGAPETDGIRATGMRSGDA
jgi:DeoR family transcriptional regulator, aga operon transcriptional repressor